MNRAQIICLLALVAAEWDGGYTAIIDQQIDAVALTEVKHNVWEVHVGDPTTDLELNATVTIQPGGRGETAGTSLCLTFFRSPDQPGFNFPHSWHHAWFDEKQIALAASNLEAA